MKIVVFIIFTIVFSGAYGQSDSIKNVTEFSSVVEGITTKPEFIDFDTILNSFYNFKNDGRKHISSLGNEGLSFNSMLFPEIKYGFNSGENSFNSNFIETSERNIYHTNKPFARISYRSGAKKYKDFDVFFTENINKNFNFSIRYNAQSSTGFYINQFSETRQFSFQNSFRSNKGNYGYLLSFKVNSGDALENGGIKSDSLYSELLKLSSFDADNNKLKVQTWLEGDSNFYDHRNLYLTQFLRLYKMKTDSGDFLQLFLGLTNEGGYDDLWFNGNYSDRSYYSRFGVDIVDSSFITDQSHLFYLKNEGYLKLSTGKNKPDFILGGSYNYYDNTNLVLNSKFYESGAFFKVNNVKLGRLRFFANINKGIEGYNKEGYKLNFNIEYLSLNKDFRGTVYSVIQNSLPEYKFLNYGGNTISWNNDFKYVNGRAIGLNIESFKYKFGVYTDFETVNNFVYYSETVVPKQYNNRFWRYEIELKKEFVFNKIHLNVSVLNQAVENIAPINLASWIIHASIYHQSFLFKEALEFRYGLDYWQNSSYYAASYAPFTRSFIYQNTYTVGNYPYFNFYLSARIKSAQGFVNFQNIGQFVFRKNYMMIPDYALQDFGISFGLRWDFIN